MKCLVYALCLLVGVAAPTLADEMQAVPQPDGSVEIVAKSPLEIAANLCRAHQTPRLGFQPGFDGAHPGDADCPKVMQRWVEYLKTLPIVPPGNEATPVQPPIADRAAIAKAIGK